jgi:branched-chain amino acid aminotransferase
VLVFSELENFVHIKELEKNMFEDRIVYLRGEFVAWQQATVHIMSHSFGRGSAIFEVISFHATDSGPAIFRLDEHIKRLFKTAELLDMELPLSRSEFCRAAVETVKRNQLNQGIIKIICYYPQFSVEVLPPQNPLEVSIFALDPDQYLKGRLPTTGSTTAGISKWRKLDPQTVPVPAKAAANYLNGMVARLDVRKRGLVHAVMLDTQGFIGEGATESLFLVKAGRLMTPALGTVLGSITRMSILEAAELNGLQTFEGRLDPALLYEAEELFFSCSPLKVLPVRQIEDRVLSNIPGQLTQRMGALMDDIVKGKDARFKNWLYPVD